MKRAAGCVLVCAGLLWAEVYIPGALIEAQSASVTVETYDSLGQPLSSGGGFFYQDSGEVITARHVVKDAYRVLIRTSQGRSIECKQVTGEDRQWDLVRLKVDSKISSVIRTVSCEVTPEEDVIILGPEARFNGTGSRQGEVSGVREIQGFGSIIELSATLAPGFSGSPVVDLSGNLIGVVTFEVAGDRIFYYAVPAQRLDSMLEDKSQTFREWKTSSRCEIDEPKDELYIQGLELLKGEKWESALCCFTQVISISPLYVVAYPMIGYCNLQLGRWENAIGAYYQALLVNPEDAVAYNNISVAYGKLGLWGEAMAASRQSVRIAPGDAGFRCGLGIAYSKLGEWERARETFGEALDLDPGCAAAHYGFGLCSWALEDQVNAWRSYHRLLELDADLAEGLRLYLED